MTARADTVTLAVDGVHHRLGVAVWGAGSPAVVFVHDGLGSIEQWRDVPARTSAAAGRAVLAYNRAGHGSSEPVPPGAWPTDWMSHEAVVLAALIDRVAAGPVRLVGHSDGATIALLCAAERPDLVADVVTLAPHSWVEAKCVEAIAALRADPGGLIAALGRFHVHPAELFEAWSGGWTRPEFASWDIRPRLAAITAPALVVQGDDDAYATEAMVLETAAAIGTNAAARFVPDCGHAIHLDAPELVIALAAGGPGATTRR
jgi:pimeloyl-ACP methyl ester carboxylesterase